MGEFLINENWGKLGSDQGENWGQINIFGKLGSDQHFRGFRLTRTDLLTVTSWPNYHLA